MGLGSCFMGGVSFMVTMAPIRLRGSIREKYNINGTDQEDCTAYLCCPCCARFQESGELDAQLGQLANPLDCVPLCMEEFTTNV